MDRGTVARIEDWDSQDLDGGYAGLQRLADADFTGAVTANGAWAFLLNGKVLGVFDGTMDAFESTAGVAYEAPHPSLPLLFAMQETGGDVQAEYYTDDTPLREVDSTLSEGGFTGFIELSENVLSGDYYVAYYGGRSLSAAFVGNAERLLVGDEAFEKASEEVGIYSVITVDLDVQDVPEPTGTGGPAGVAVDTEDGSVDDAGETPGDGATSVADDEVEAEGGAAPSVEPLDPSPDAATEAATQDEESVDETVPTAAEVGAEDETSSAVADPEPEQDPGPDPETAAETDESPTDPAPADGTIEEAESEPPTEPRERSTPDGADTAATAGEPATTVEEAEPADSPSTEETPSDDAVGPQEDPFSEEEAWRETRTVPALDPDQSQEAVAREPEHEAPRPEPEPNEPPPTDSPTDGDDATSPPPAAEEGLRERVETLESTVHEREGTIQELRDRLEDVTDERDSLRDRVERLRSRLDAADAGSDGAAGVDLDPDTALARTDLFVRYGSKGKATLMDAHDDDASKADVTANLRLETHTRFEAADSVVDGEPFEAYLADRTEYRFVEWLVGDLLFEVLETGKQRALRHLFDAIPRIDRVELRGTADVEDEDGTERSIEFDLVFRDRMGRPLVVADVNDSRDPATDDMMADLIEGASTVAAGHDSLGGAFLVTSSFFRPDALEVATDETGGGFLSRESRSSFVKLGRKNGYHLCLVEARDGDFHVAVPEL